MKKITKDITKYLGIAILFSSVPAICSQQSSSRGPIITSFSGNSKTHTQPQETHQAPQIIIQQVVQPESFKAQQQEPQSEYVEPYIVAEQAYGPAIPEMQDSGSYQDSGTYYGPVYYGPGVAGHPLGGNRGQRRDNPSNSLRMLGPATNPAGTLATTFMPNRPISAPQPRISPARVSPRPLQSGVRTPSMGARGGFSGRGGGRR